MRALVSLAAVSLLLGSATAALAAEPLAKVNEPNKPQSVKSLMRSGTTPTYIGSKTQMDSTKPSASSEASARESGRFAKSAVSEAVKPLARTEPLQPSAEASARSALGKVSAQSHGAAKSHFAQALEPSARNLMPGSRSLLGRSATPAKEADNKSKLGAQQNKFPRN